METILNHSLKSNRELYAKNFIKCHMGFVSDNAPRYFDMVDRFADQMPNSVNEIEKLNEQWEKQSREYIDGKTTWEKFTDTIEDWTVKTLELYDRTLSNVH